MAKPAPAAKTWNRIDGVDLLRGLAIFFVLMNHVNMRLLGARVPYTRGIPPQLTSALVWNGQAAVQMFFVISGYLITSTSIRRWGSPAALRIRDFYMLRFARIAPLLILLLLLLSVLHLAHVPGYVVSAKTGGLPRALLAMLTLHVGYLEATRGYLPAAWDILWSLCVEEMFYLAFPLAARLLRKQWLLITLLAVFILAGPFARTKLFNPNPVWREYSYLGGMDAIAFGCLTAILLSHRRISKKTIGIAAIAGSILLIFVLCFSLQASRLGLQRSGLSFTVLGIGVSLLIAAAAQSSWRAPRLLAPLLILGQRSYEIYLTHVFALLALFTIFVHFGKPLRAVPILFVSAILSAGLLGFAVSIFYTEPMNRFLRNRSGTGKNSLGAARPEAD